MGLWKFLLFAIVALSLTKNAVQGAAPGELSRRMCKKYLKYVPKSYNCQFMNKSLTIGNYFAKEGEFPHMVMLGYKNRSKILWRCSASLISDRYVLAAAHCLNISRYGAPTVVRLGVTNLTNSINRHDIKVAKVIAHPAFRTSSVYNDIGLVKLKKKVSIDVRIRPACLYTKKDIGTNLVINTGWGDTRYGGTFDNRLQKVVLEPYDVRRCNRTYHRSHRKITRGINNDTMVCAGSKSVFTYQPNWGGPTGPLAIIHKEGRNHSCIYDLVGVASFGKPSVDVDIPTVFTRVSAYIKWIEDTVWK